MGMVLILLGLAPNAYRNILRLISELSAALFFLLFCFPIEVDTYAEVEAPRWFAVAGFIIVGLTMVATVMSH
jgi:hypothetical protein